MNYFYVLFLLSGYFGTDSIKFFIFFVAMGFSGKEAAVVILLTMIQFTNIVDSMIMMPLGNIFIDMFSIDAGELSLLIASYAIGAFLSSMAGVIYLDRFDRKNTLILVYLGFTLGTYLCALATSYWMLVGIRFFTGLFGGVLGALVLSIVSDVFPFSRRGQAIGMVTAAFSAASALGVPVGLFLADTVDWHAPFIFLGILGTAILILLWNFLPNLKEHIQENSSKGYRIAFRSILKDKNQYTALGLSLIIVLGHFVIIPFITPYMVRNVGFTQSQITLIYFTGGILTLFTSPITGKLTDRFGVITVFKWLLFLSFIPVLLLTNLPQVSVFAGLLVTSVFFVLGSGRMIPPNTQITAAVGREGRGAFMSIKSALQQLGIALSSVISGAVIFINEDGSLANYGWIGILSIVISCSALYILPRLKVASDN